MIFKNAICQEIREGDGGQRFTFTNENGKSETMWLVGIDRHPSVKVGDTGRFDWSATRAHGRYTFIKDES